jgi:RNA polymerase sigma-54 factor
MLQSQKLVMRQEQQLRMTPQLYQAIRIMALPLVELRTTIEQELERNPALEVVEDRSVLSLNESDRRQGEEAEYFDDTPRSSRPQSCSSATSTRTASTSSPRRRCSPPSACRRLGKSWL